MSQFWALIAFTLLAQCAVGLAIATMLTPRASAARARRAWLVAGLMAVAVLSSLTHLGSPVIAFYAVSNPGSSWLSREIVMLILTGAAVLVWAVLKKDIFGWIAILLGLGLMAAMSYVYRIDSQTFWSNAPGVFSGAALTLGGTLSFVLDAVSFRKESASLHRSLFSPPTMLALAGIALSIICIQQQKSSSEWIALAFMAHTILLALGAAFFTFIAGKASSQSANAPVWAYLMLFLVVSAGALCGRAVFYAGYIELGM